MVRFYFLAARPVHICSQRNVNYGFSGSTQLPMECLVCCTYTVVVVNGAVKQAYRRGNTAIVHSGRVLASGSATSMNTHYEFLPRDATHSAVTVMTS